MKKQFAILILFILLPNRVLLTNPTLLRSFLDLFDEICDTVANHFYSSKIIDEKFPTIRDNYRAKVLSVSSEEEFSVLINDMLGGLHASHTHYYTKDDCEYYHLAAIFQFVPEIKHLFKDEEIKYPSIGIFTQTIGEKVFVVSVLPGSSAERAGLQKGDEIVAVDGKPYAGTQAWRDKIGEPTELAIRRTRNGTTEKISVVPQSVNPKAELLQAERASVKIFKRSEKEIGYIHIWSYAGPEYHRAFLDAIADTLHTTDALIWDLRYGWGGANPAYLDVFNKNVPNLIMIDRDGTETTFDTRWRKPVVMLVNETVRSGKEILAYGFKKYKLGTVIGEPTAGATLAGKLFVLSNQAMLYLAVKDTRINGEDLEGIGVEPDLLVPMDVRYCQGKDIQLDAAIESLLKGLRMKE